eukprot:COSAG02_NODE_3313_length_6953_cov_95.249635_9_plen_42_part_00
MYKVSTYKLRMHSHSTQALHLSAARELWTVLGEITFKLHQS